MKRISGPGDALADYALITEADVRGYLKNPTGTADVDLIADILENVQRRFAEELGGRIIKDTGTNYDYVLDCHSWSTLYLPHYPIVSISLVANVTMEGGGVFNVNETFSSADYETDCDSGTIYAVNKSFWTGRNCVRVTWRAGYTVVPASIRDAVCQWAVTVYNRLSGQRLDKLSEAHEADSTSYSRLDRPDSVQAVIDHYRYLEATIA